MGRGLGHVIYFYILEAR